MRPSPKINLVCRLYAVDSQPFPFRYAITYKGPGHDGSTSGPAKTYDDAVALGMEAFYSVRRQCSFMAAPKFKIKWVNDVPKGMRGVRSWPWLEFVPIAKESRKPTRRQSSATAASGLIKQGRSGASQTLG